MRRKYAPRADLLERNAAAANRSAWVARSATLASGLGSSRFLLDIQYALTYATGVPGEPMVKPITASEARADLYRLIDQTSESHQPILISGKRSSAVLVSAEDWQAIQETLYLLSVPGMRESIKKGMAEPLGKGAKTVVW
jgi:antitoxin YefM